MECLVTFTSLSESTDAPNSLLSSSFSLISFSLIQSFLFLDFVLLHTFGLFPSLCSLPFPGIFSHLPTSLTFTKHSPCTMSSALCLLCLMLALRLYHSLSSGPEFTWADVMSVIFHLILSSFSAGLLKPAQLPVTLTASGVLLASVNPSPFPLGPLFALVLWGSVCCSGSHQLTLVLIPVATNSLPCPLLSKTWVCYCLCRCLSPLPDFNDV